MKRILVPLIAIILLCSMLACALAEGGEYPHLTEADLMGLWVCTENPDLSLAILPGYYAPQSDGKAQPNLYGQCVWPESRECRIVHCLYFNAAKGNEFLLGSGLLGMAFNALSDSFLSHTTVSDIDYTSLNYEKSDILLGYTFEEEEEETYYSFRDDSKGTVFCYYDDDGTVILNWYDENDPHVSAYDFVHEICEMPTIQSLTERALRPVIDAGQSSPGETCLKLMQFAAQGHMINAETDALRDGVRAALDALDAPERQAFRDSYMPLGTVITDALGLTVDRNDIASRFAAFETEALRSAAKELLLGNAANRRSAEVFHTAVLDALSGN